MVGELIEKDVGFTIDIIDYKMDFLAVAKFVVGFKGHTKNTWAPRQAPREYAGQYPRA